jgi:GNAT superfamily N-acetyltransferase
VVTSRVVVRPVTAADRWPWLDLWGQYCAFYGAEVPERATQTTWERIVAREGPVVGLVAEAGDSGAFVGFAHYVLHPFTWGDRLACYLEDLFVRPDARGAGIGGALMQHLFNLGIANGWARVYWMTQKKNAAARRLYDRFAAADDFVRYTVNLDGSP